MKKFIIRIVIASAFAFLALINFQLNTKPTAHRDTNLALQQVEAAVICVEYYFNVWSCCGDGGTTCNAYGIPMAGPWLQ